MIGTRSADTPGVKAHRDRADAILMLRVEVNALTALLIEKRLFTVDEFMAQIVTEWEHKQRELEAMFPGYRATDIGISIDPAVAEETNRRMGFPP
jgi:antibiotic biosynthesis monooxygenase (ABM) superfamily enzyme